MSPERREEIARLIDEWEERVGLEDFCGSDEWDCIVYERFGDEKSCMSAEGAEKNHREALALAQQIGISLPELLVWDRLQRIDDSDPS